MTQNTNRPIFDFLWDYRRRWLLPAVVISLIVALFAVVRQDTWEATQALIVRNEAFSAERGPGKFAYPEEMKTVQETILELVRSRSVLVAALSEVGPPSGYKKSLSVWPSEEDIELARKDVKLTPPKGAEFGKTEIFYLTVRAHDQQRAMALNKALYKQLQTRFQQLRDAKAQSMTAELEKTVLLAKADLAKATAELATTEREIGSDLAELRAMQELASSDSALRRSGEEIRSQIRENNAREQVLRELLQIVIDSQKDPLRLTAAPNRLLEAHPALRQLKEGLIGAQLRTAALLGTMSENHPRVQAAKEAEAEIVQELRRELLSAQQGIELELQLCTERNKLLHDQLTETTRRLARLAEVRASYENQTAEVKNRLALLERAEQNLSEARAARAAALAASLLSPIDATETGVKPLGPSRLTIALSGIFGGFLAGFGVLLLSVPPTGLSVGRRDKAAVSGNGHVKSPRPAAANAPLSQALQSLSRRSL